MPPSLASALGRIAPVILDEVARRAPLWTDRAFARFLGIDSTLISRWRRGDRGMPVEVLPLLAQYTGDPELVYGDLLARAGCRVAKEYDETETDLETAIHTMRRRIGEMIVTLADATDPAGPSGPSLDPDEQDEVLDEVVALRQDAGRLEAAIRMAQR
jgi:transcriptional regulator with XRE-family HTH domain